MRAAKLMSPGMFKLIVWTVVAIGAGCAGAESYSAASEFSSTSNPTGVWSYGFRGSAADTSLTLFGNSTGTDLVAWDRGLAFPNNYPRVVSNQSAAPIFWGTDVALEPGQLGYHPGPSGEFCVVRFTAPSAGDWVYVTASTNLDKISDGMGISVVVNGVALFSSALPGGTSGVSVNDSQQVTLAAGDTIDFVVGSVGGNTGDTAQLAATVRAIPAPGAAMLLGVASLAGVRRRRTRVS